jgi:2-dehydropantoate 2-reductase
VTESQGPIVIAGAGSIGCYVGGCLALAGKPVVFLGRPRIATALSQHGLTVTDLEGRSRKLEPGAIKATDDHAVAFHDAALVLVCVKSGGTEQMAQSIDRHAPERTAVISLQNGVENAGRIASTIRKPHPVISGMVPFNVVIEDEGPIRVHRATDGDILIDGQMPGLVETLKVEGLPIGTSPDMKGVLWSKLLMNLNNALVALSDLPLAEELGDRAWRRLLAQQIDEALAALNGADIKAARLSGVSPSLLPTILRLPNWLFGLVARRMLAVDPKARSSMWEDLVRGRSTEIDEFQGAILRLAAYTGTDTPLTQKIADVIRAAEVAGKGSPKLRPADLAI